MNEILPRPPTPPTRAEEVDLSWLRDSLGFLISIARAQMFECFLDDLAAFGLRPAEFSALWVIHRNPGIRQGLLAESLRLKRAHMTKMIRALEERGLVRRTVPDSDRRSVELRLTPAGERFLCEHGEAFYTHDFRRPSSLDRAEQAQLRALLQKFVGLSPDAPR